MAEENTSKKRLSKAEQARNLMEPVAEQFGLELWDVQFEKEGSQWYLRYLLDKAGGLTILDAENASHAISDLLDNEDFIQQQYMLEVGSPGIDRKLTADWHFQRHLGQRIQVRFYKAFDGSKSYEGVLLRKEGSTITLLLDEEKELTFEQEEAANLQLVVDLKFGGNNK